MGLAERNAVVARLAADLMGPLSVDEEIADRPSDRYLTGILYPQQSLMDASDDEQLMQAADSDDDDTAAPESVSLASSMRPSSAGISFAVSSAGGGTPTVVFHISCGTYQRFYVSKPEKDDVAKFAGRRADERWRRRQHDSTIGPVDLGSVDSPIDLSAFGFDGLKLYLQVLRQGKLWTVTAALVNCHADAGSRVENDQHSFFQTELIVETGHGTTFTPRPSIRAANDDDGRIAELIYRDAYEYATGHTCSAEWVVSDGKVQRVQSAWLPNTVVAATSTQGDEVFRILDSEPNLRPLSARWLSEASSNELGAALTLIPDAYNAWIARERKRVGSLPETLKTQAERQLEVCEIGRDRMRDAVRLLVAGGPEFTAFQLANRAMQVQRKWQHKSEDLSWRPFQIGFLLLTLASLSDRNHIDRKVMDLLWFPTGGGKTEAYLALTAYILFLRRLRDGETLGAGVAVLMRYTLRLLTTQQFERAAALICACEHLRRGHDLPAGLAPNLGDIPFSIGLWVGQGATPNRVAEAANLGGAELGQATPKQLVACPCCSGILGPCVRVQGSIRTRCSSPKCPFGAVQDGVLPVWTVDEDVYRHRPSLVIGTIDKFAAITRRPDETGLLFGLGTPHCAPDLIIQDELHLISGPLGTVAALYEVAIDELCSRDGRRPKIIGSTATIRRAASQIRALFGRDTYQFPAPGLDWDNSCFAVRDKDKPGRLYVGLTTAGRSPKFALQAVSASLLQSGQAIRHAGTLSSAVDPYWTLVGYFNSLRELGGAVVLVQDDVVASVREYAMRRSELPRRITPAVELTSRRSSSEIPVILRDLKRTCDDAGSYDVLLASNMISVGVDVPRLGLMVVNGQPKLIAEYIQATSRVGRTEPGLVITVFNNGKTRDRAYFETFTTWHGTLYREVEATSVTPFASRALDKAVHAVLVALVRQRVVGMKAVPTMSSNQRTQANAVATIILQRARDVDQEELPAVQRKVTSLLTEWEQRTDLQAYWDDFRGMRTLLISAEQAAALRAAKMNIRRSWPTPNSMRDVEPTTPFVMVNRLRERQDPNNASE
jgi:hypothetical protein